MSTWTVGTEIGVAVGTLGLALVTSRLVGRTADLAEVTSRAVTQAARQATATEEQAEATARQAEATARQAEATARQVEISAVTVKEIQRDRELAHRPVLSMAVSSIRQARALASSPEEEWAVRNAGGGAAIGVRLVRPSGDDEYALSPPVDIPPGGEAPGFNLAEADIVPLPFDPLAMDDERFPRGEIALFCTDILDRRIRFVVIRAPDRVVRSAEISRLDDPAAPPWVSYRRLWGYR
jgi:hypothetical protein